MPQQTASLSIEIKAQTDDAKAKLKELQHLSKAFGAQIANSFASAIVHSRNLGDALRGLALSLSQIMLRAALTPFGNAAGGLLAQAFKGLHGFAAGGVVSQGMVKPFASGGVVAAPTLFPLQGGAGLTGEAGAEAILPLARGADGKLGVRAGTGGTPPSITINVTTPDVEGFRRAEGQLAATLARVISRGQRNL